MLPSIRKTLSIFMCIWCSALAGVYKDKFGSITKPPDILEQPDQMVPFKQGDRLLLPCDAKADPDPRFYWEKDGEQLVIDGTVISQQQKKGTIIFSNPLETDEGFYQCFAYNEYGTAATQKTQLRTASVMQFPSILSPTRQHVALGSHLTLRCLPPQTYPEPDVFWATIRRDKKIRQVQTDNRITMDDLGNLHFVNVQKSDESMPGSKYVCTVNNPFLRTLVQGEDAEIDVVGETAPKRAPALMWSTPENRPVALRDEFFKLKCIFSGYPTPDVSWKRIDKPMGDSPHIYTDHFGQELIFSSVTFDDAGTYQCEGKNGLEVNRQTKSFELRVESKPYWIIKPKNEDKAEEESISFVCKAGGTPTPDVTWYIDGQPIKNAKDNSRRIILPGNITYINLTKSDAQVIQCNASNSHGYLYTNAYLNVLAEPPSWKAPPDQKMKHAVGQIVNITCSTYAAPKAKVKWVKDGVVLSGSHYKFYKDGNLEIQGLTNDDGGKYECEAKNKFGQLNGDAMLEIRQPTKITTKPTHKAVRVGDTIKLKCEAETDPQEKVEIDWKKDEEFIDYKLEPRIFKSFSDNVLEITRAEKTDSGIYTCVATNGLDSDKARARVRVQDKPNPPKNVKVDCYTRKDENVAIISWEPNGDNFSPIKKYIVRYNTTFAPDKWRVALEPDATVESSEFKMSPWVNYTFQVIAVNKIDPSEPSQHTAEVCRTAAARPDKNPGNVMVEGTTPTNLVISWTPMDKIEHNGENFEYVVEWECMDPDCQRDDLKKYSGKKEISDHNKREIIIEGQQTYKRYLVKMYTRNAIEISSAPTIIVYGYSGEDVPTVAPENFRVDEASITDKTANFLWYEVDSSVEVIKGFFVGYRIEYWRKEEGYEKRRETDIIINKPSSQRRRRQIVRKEMKRTVADLPAYSDVEVQARVINKKYAGPPSNIILIRTKEGTPGPVKSFKVVNQYTTALDLEWEGPEEANGVIIGYEISYSMVKGFEMTERQTEPYIDNPNRRQYRIIGLEPKQKYRVYIAGHTSKGKGDERLTDGETKVWGPPIPPDFTFTNIGETVVNVTWVPVSVDGQRETFVLHYRKTGQVEWTKQPPVTDTMWSNITGLEPGTRYEVRIMTTNGRNQEAITDLKEVTTAGYAAVVGNVAKAGWFIGMMVAIALLLLILIVVCILKRNRGGKYPVQEKEKLRGREFEPTDEAKFGEYMRDGERDQPDIAKSSGSIDSAMKVDASDSDSMSEYAETDPCKFNEDGSFIGQYGGKKIEATPDMNSPSALSTFV
ncbi:neuroglian-like isoform X2 [Lineus longissimus]|uniref:neuroglian-like isoform X2 n=1 Tax=Lineus longissimus TaxID=88925 RepID=UPI00315DB4A1